MRSHEDPENSAGGNDGGSTNRAALELSAAFREHLFCVDGSFAGEGEEGRGRGGRQQRPNSQAVALGIEALNFLRGRQVREERKDDRFLACLVACSVSCLVACLVAYLATFLVYRLVARLWWS